MSASYPHSEERRNDYGMFLQSVVPCSEEKCPNALGKGCTWRWNLISPTTSLRTSFVYMDDYDYVSFRCDENLYNGEEDSRWDLFCRKIKCVSYSFAVVFLI